MTTEIIVEKVDREAAADLEAYERDDTKRERFMCGELDGTESVQLFARHRLAERESVVAWLREEERSSLIPMPDTVIPAGRDYDDYGNEYWRPEERRKISRLPTPGDYADAIERGDHQGTSEGPDLVQRSQTDSNPPALMCHGVNGLAAHKSQAKLNDQFARKRQEEG